MVQVDADDERLDRLLQLYQHEWSGLLPRPIGEDARYEYPDLALFRDRENHAAFLFLGSDRPAPLGFALAIHESTLWHVDEFFIIAGARRQDIGTTDAGLLVESRSGPWTLTVRPENPRALAFWRVAFSGAEERVEVGDDGVTRTRLSI
ncbi:hypothetical protein BH11MYX2_BH11MYX2_12710 [soil metagenome]